MTSMTSMTSNTKTSMTSAEHPVVVLLRGINVGGNRKVPMSDLQRTLEASGCSDVTTYIQSGNAVCRAAGTNEAIEARLEPAIAATFGFHVDTVVRTAAEWAQYVSTAQFPDAASARPNLLHLALAKRPLAASAQELLAARCSDEERFALLDDALWIDFAGGAGRSKLTPAALDRAAGSPVTARNWRTVERLQALLVALG
ncbi:MAG: DUF1697 domain-containing protein [Nannocystis sp.]|nr:DUF1697 domain-containing protein [Nannocystis sp.]MBA3547907.1 DUF1697 domain-containing protein [Nannocystis sp.]